MRRLMAVACSGRVWQQLRCSSHGRDIAAQAARARRARLRGRHVPGQRDRGQRHGAPGQAAEARSSRCRPPQPRCSTPSAPAPQVKGVDNDSNYPASAPRTKLSGFTPNVEAIAAEQPDLVVVSNDAADADQAARAHSTSLCCPCPPPPNISGVYAELSQLGAATGHAAQARAEVSMLRSQIGKIVAAVPHHAQAADLLLRARPDVLLGDVGHVHRQAARPARA